MKIIGDIHGRDCWKQFLPDLFIGDYFDSWDIPGTKQIENFLDIIEYKKNNPHVILLEGNHDSSQYLDITRAIGYQPTYSWQIKEVLTANKELLQICYYHNNILYSHAGISKTWCENHDIDPDQTRDTLAHEINELWLYKPYYFSFDGKDTSGDNITQGPLWIRPNSLLKDRISGTQVVGHTAVKDITIIEDIYFIDCLDKKTKILEI